MPELNREQVQTILRTYFQGQYKRRVDAFQASPAPTSPGERDEREDEIHDAVEDAAGLSQRINEPGIGKREATKLEELCRESGLEWQGLERVDQIMLLRGVREADSRVQHAYVDVLRGHHPSKLYVEDVSGTFTLATPAPVQVAQDIGRLLQDPNSFLQTSPTVTVAVERLIQANPNWSEKTMAEYERYLKRFTDFVGSEVRVHTITKDHLSAYLQSLREGGRSKKAAAIHKHTDGLSPKTLNLHMDPVRMLFAHAVERDDIIKSPFKKHHKVPLDDLDEGTPRIPYDAARRAKLFGSASFNAPNKVRVSG